MSISTLQNKEKRLLRELESLSRRRERLSKSKQKSAFSKLLKTSKDIAKKNSELTDTRQKLAKERKKEQDNQLKQMKDAQQEANRIVKSGIKLYDQQSKEYDVFISYVQSDSLEYVDKLEQALKQKNVEVWRDKSDMIIGQSMTQAIENGLVKSKLAIVVLSPNYLCKYWTNFELDGIFSKQGLTGEQMILPIWNNVSAEDIAKKRPSLANLLAWNVSTDTIENISTSVANLLGIKNGGEIDA